MYSPLRISPNFALFLGPSILYEMAERASAARSLGGASAISVKGMLLILRV